VRGGGVERRHRYDQAPGLLDLTALINSVDLRIDSTLKIFAYTPQKIQFCFLKKGSIVSIKDFPVRPGPGGGRAIVEAAVPIQRVSTKERCIRKNTGRSCHVVYGNCQGITINLRN